MTEIETKNPNKSALVLHIGLCMLSSRHVRQSRIAVDLVVLVKVHTPHARQTDRQTDDLLSSCV